MQDFIIDTMNQFGYIGIFFLIAIENLFPPIPSEVILTFGGFMTTYTRMQVMGVVLTATLGSTIGAIILYKVGALLTPERLEKLLDLKLFQFLGFKKGDVFKTVHSFEEHGKMTILYGRCIPIIRSLISIPAGMAGISMGPFLFYTVLGSFVWNAVLVSLGAFMGASWDTINELLHTYSSAVSILFKAVLFLWVLNFLRKRIRDYKTKVS